MIPGGEMAEQMTIKATENGPYLVTGNVIVTDTDGNQYHTDRATVALCRCGGSQNKPFCDGTHSRTGFQAAERAVREAEGEA
jgi:CDGSH-type Zn-finger protein